jgi:hypothetical protein
MQPKMHWLIPLATMVAGAALAMALIGAVVGQLDAPTQGHASAAAPSR